MPPKKKKRVPWMKEVPTTTFVEILGSAGEKSSLSVQSHDGLYDTNDTPWPLSLQDSNNIHLSQENETLVNGSSDLISESEQQTAYASIQVIQDQDGEINLETESKYATQRRRRHERWSELRKHLVNAIVEENAPHLSTLCNLCKKETPDCIRCRDCGPSAFFCADCCHDHHSIIILHTPEIWKDNRFVPFILPCSTLGRTGHQCSASYIKSITLIDQKGFPHDQTLRLCYCEEEAVTLTRYGFWPATPITPTTAISIELLTTLRSLVFSGQLSLTAFANALQQRHARPYAKAPKLIRVFTWEMMLNFNRVYHEVHSLEYLSIPVAPSHACAACPKEGKVIAIDGNFSLVRRKGTGSTAYLPQRHPDRFFFPQAEIDDFVAKYSEKSSRNENTCSNFQAGNVIRSKNTTEKLDVKGIFGSVCRHDVPFRFMDLKHGERLAYPVYMVQNIRDQSKMIFYDIACQLESHLKKKNDLLPHVIFVVPIFHVYGHIMRCQIMYSPRRMKGAGLMDGEGTERLWSFLGDFSNITKEMTGENRRDLLTDLLLHYTTKLNNQMVKILCQRMHRACLLSQTSDRELTEIISSLPVLVTRDDIDNWSESERERFVSQPIKVVPDWKEAYVLLLDEYYSRQRAIREKSDEDDIDEDHFITFSRLQSKIIKIEKKQKIGRWDMDSLEYKEVLKKACEKERARLLYDLRQEVVEYTFLKNCRKRYSDGQKQANKLNKQLIASSKKVDVALQRYNDIPSLSRKVNRSEALELQSFLYDEIDDIQEETQIPRATKRKAIDVYNLQQRCEEEIKFLIEDMSTYSINVRRQKQALLSKRETLTEEDSLTRLEVGVIASLNQAICDVEVLDTLVKDCFSPLLRTRNLMLEEFVDHLDNLAEKDEELSDGENDES